MGNKLKVQIENYRSITSKVEFTLNKNTEPRMLWLIGNNNSGKTNILDAIYSLNKVSIKKSDKVGFLENGMILNSTDDPKISVDVLFSDNGKDFPITSTLSNGGFTNNGLDPDFIKKNEDRARKLLEEFKKTNYKSKGAFLSGSEFTVFTEDYRWKSFISAVASVGDPKITKMAEDIRKLLLLNSIEKKLNVKYLKNINMFKYTELDMGLAFVDNNDVEGVDLEKKQILSLWEKIVGMSFDDILLDKSKTERRERANFINAFNIRANNLITSIVETYHLKMNYQFSLELSADDNLLISLKPKTPANQKIVWNDAPETSGDGIKSLWSYIFALNSIDKNEPCIILMDEPEKSLNPETQSLFCSYLENFFSRPDRINQLLILTTHSPFMLSKSNWYQNTYIVRRDETTNSSLITPIYDSARNGISNYLLEKNFELRYIETLFGKIDKKSVLFVEGISDFFALVDIATDSFIVPLFGSEYITTATFHLPYLINSYGLENIKLIVDNDKQGAEIQKWFIENTGIYEKNISFYSDFIENSTKLEDSLLQYELLKNNIECTGNKKIDAINFRRLVLENKVDLGRLVKLLSFLK